MMGRIVKKLGIVENSGKLGDTTVEGQKMYFHHIPFCIFWIQCHVYYLFKNKHQGIPTAGGTGLIPGQGPKIPCKLRHSQK